MEPKDTGTGMDIGQAMQALKDGIHVRRAEWPARAHLELRMVPTLVMVYEETDESCAHESECTPSAEDALARDWGYCKGG